MAPGALLLEAQKEYEKESQKADEYLREIKDQKLLPEAVSQCIEAAGYEHEPETQKSLLRVSVGGGGRVWDEADSFSLLCSRPLP
nr:PREDICTED: vacuolar protein sorting-associated protein 16 homolog [Apteryx mantelli mantelli]